MSVVRIVGFVVCAVAISSVVACSSSSGSSSGNPPASAGGNPTPSSQNAGSYQLDPAVTTLRLNADAASVDLTAQEGAQVISVTEQTRGATTTKDVTVGLVTSTTAEIKSGLAEGDTVITGTASDRVATSGNNGNNRGFGGGGVTVNGGGGPVFTRP